MSEQRPRGLASINSARDERSRRKYGRPAPNAILIAVGGALVVLLIYWFASRSQLESAKTDLLAQQRAAKSTVGAEWFPLRDKLEKITVEAAGPYVGDMVDKEAASWDFRTLPGIYLRMRVEQAKDAPSIRRAAQDSLRDGFTSCLFRETPAQALARLQADAGINPDHPWNLRQAYQSTRVLDEAWEGEVKAATDDLRLRVFSQQYEKAKREEIPLAVDIVKRSQFFMLVLDEDVDEARGLTDAGGITSEGLQQVAHPSRVFLVNLKNGATLARLRKTGSAGVVMTGAVVDEETQAAMKRQVNNCSLAQQVWASIKPSTPN
jgi:hypothetical protein